jgi:hypothetical protein
MLFYGGLTKRLGKKMEEDHFERVIVSSPLYLFALRQPCYSCASDIETIAIATAKLVDLDFDDPQGMAGEVCLLSNVQSVPAEIMEQVICRHPKYELRYSGMAEQEYLMTVCQCGAHQGDFYVHQALFNAACYEPETIKVEQLLLEGVWQLDCSYSSSSVYEVLIERAI